MFGWSDSIGTFLESFFFFLESGISNPSTKSMYIRYIANTYCCLYKLFNGSKFMAMTLFCFRNTSESVADIKTRIASNICKAEMVEDVRQTAGQNKRNEEKDGIPIDDQNCICTRNINANVTRLHLLLYPVLTCQRI